MVIDRYVFDPAQGTGLMAVKATQGAMRFVTGKIGKIRDHDVAVVTPEPRSRFAEPTSVGPINGKYGVLLLKGKVRVSGDTGRRTKK